MQKIIGAFAVLFLVCSFGIFHAQELIPQSPIELNLLSHHDKNTIEQRSKLEIGFILPFNLQQKIQNFFNDRAVNRKQKINPFLEWELLVEATFIHEETGEKIVRQGFYYRKMQRDIQNDTWIDVKDDYTLRVRFLPEKIGAWSCDLVIKEHGKTTYNSLTFDFYVNPSKNPGYVKVHKDKRFFERDGKIIVPTGINQPSPYVGNNMIHNWSNEAKLSMNAWELFINDVENYALQGGQFLRFFLMPSCSDIEFETLGNYYERLNFAWEIDNMLEICEREDVLINFNMLYHTPFMRMADYHQFRWDYTSNWHDPEAWPYRDQNPVYAYSTYLGSSTPSDMFLNEETMNYAKQRVRYIIARWGYSTAISTFELMSEPWHISEDWFHKETPYDSIGAMGDDARKAAHNFHKEISKYIKNDLKHDYQPLGAVGKLRRGNDEIFTHPSNPAFNYKDSTWFEDEIDFISISYYSSDPSKMIISKKGRSNNECEDSENSVFCAVESLHEQYQKPILLGEADHGDGTHYCSELEGHYIDIMRYNLNGVAGHYLWRVFAYPHETNQATEDERESWPSIIVAQEFFNSVPLQATLEQFGAQGREKRDSRGVSTDIKEHQYIISQEGKSAVGYIYNRSYNVHTAPINQEDIENTSCFISNEELNSPNIISWKPKKMKIEGLNQRTDYTLKYYGYKTGSFINASAVKSNLFGKITLEHPDLGLDRNTNPLIWYVLEQN